MSGNEGDLVAEALETFEGDEKRLSKEALFLLLGKQWVMSNEFPNQIWKVSKGSGMNEDGQHVQ